MPRRIEIDLDELKQLYEEEELSSRQLARHYHCSESTILIRLHEAGAKIRPQTWPEKGKEQPMTYLTYVKSLRRLDD